MPNKYLQNGIEGSVGEKAHVVVTVTDVSMDNIMEFL